MPDGIEQEQNEKNKTTGDVPLQEGSVRSIVERPGYFGKRRTNKIKLYDTLYGPGNWAECWEIKGNIVDFDEAVALYDEAYYQFLLAHPEIVQMVISYGECYDNDPSNVACGTTHDPLSVPRHIQDISVRRALKKLGVWFTGPADKLLEIRSADSNGYILSPGNVPFHRPELINTENGGHVPKWASPNSVEAMWQANKVVVRENCI